MEWLDIITKLIPLGTLYIAYLTYKMNKHEIERKRKKELEDNEKDASLPPRSKKRPKR